MHRARYHVRVNWSFSVKSRKTCRARGTLPSTPARRAVLRAPLPSAGRVVSILDGDTIEVLHNQHPERIRLNGIDCPEKGQAFGTRAKQATSELVFGKDVMLQTHGKDRRGRTIADVLLLDGTSVNQQLVRHGWCWWFQKHAPNDITLRQSQEEARKQRRDYGPILIRSTLVISAAGFRCLSLAIEQMFSFWTEFTGLSIV